MKKRYLYLSILLLMLIILFEFSSSIKNGSSMEVQDNNYMYYSKKDDNIKEIVISESVSDIKKHTVMSGYFKNIDNELYFILDNPINIEANDGSLSKVDKLFFDKLLCYNDFDSFLNNIRTSQDTSDKYQITALLNLDEKKNIHLDLIDISSFKNLTLSDSDKESLNITLSGHFKEEFGKVHFILDQDYISKDGLSWKSILLYPQNHPDNSYGYMDFISMIYEQNYTSYKITGSLSYGVDRKLYWDTITSIQTR